jgi:hypothetical protein
MRLFTPLFCVFVAAPSVLAFEPQEIIDTLNNLRNQANAITPKLEKLYDPKVQSTLQDVWVSGILRTADLLTKIYTGSQDSKAPLDALTADYIQFGDNVVGPSSHCSCRSRLS